MIEICLNASDINELKKFFNAQEVYSDTIITKGNKLGFIKNGSSWGRIFYYVNGVLKDNTIILDDKNIIELLS